MTDDSADRLDTGMHIAEALKHAETWWDQIGRHLAKQINNDVEQGRKVAVSSGNAPGLVIPGEHVPTVPSKILQGLPWAQLDDRDKHQVVRAWYGKWKLERGEPLSEHGLDVVKRLDLETPKH